MYDQPGKRVPVINDTDAPLDNNVPACLGGHVGWTFKNTQIDRWQKPGTSGAEQIQIGEECLLAVTGTHELELAGLLAQVERGDKLFIDAASNVVVTSPAGGAGAADEVQTAKVQATGGTFKLTCEGEQTAALKFNATHQEVQAALEALDAIHPGDVAVSAGPGDEAGTTPYKFTFGGRFADTDVPAITADATALTGGEHKITIATTTAGAAGSDEILPLGIVDLIDTGRSPAVARVNTSDLKPFINV